MIRFKISAIVFSALLCSLLQAASYDALVTAVRGNVLELDAQQQVVRTLSSTATVPEGHAIRTQSGGTATIILANGAVITLQPETTLVLEEMQLDGDASLASYRPLRPSPANTRTRLRIERGEILGEIKGIRRNSKFEVTSAVGTAGITGTKFAIKVVVVGNRYTMTITNIDGSVVSTIEGGVAETVPAGTAVELSGTFDSATGTISEAISSQPANAPASALQNFSAVISEAVEDASDQVEGTGELMLVPDLIPLSDPDADVVNDLDVNAVVTGTPL
jgi:hypothetical protein